MLVEQRHRLVGVLQHVELDVGLVEDHRDVARDTPRTKSAISSIGSAVEVGLFGLQTITSRVAPGDLLGHLVELVRV